MIRVLRLRAGSCDHEARVESQLRDEASLNGWDFYHTGVLPGEGRDSTVVFACGRTYHGPGRPSAGGIATRDSEFD
jgi:hypothetical protein